jgi:hypothetical protein
MTDLSTDEQTILLIAAKGERLIPIGRWKESIGALLKRGLLVRERHPGDPDGYFNNVISPSGRLAVDALETGYDEVLSDMVHVSNAIGHVQTRLRADAERIAAMLVELARESEKVTGDTAVTALENWTRVIVKRSLEMVK